MKKSILAIFICGIANFLTAEHQFIPLDSKISAKENTLQKLLLNPMEDKGILHKGGWHMNELSAEPAENVQPKVGSVALTLQGTADIRGGKGDFSLTDNIPGNCRYLGIWVYLDENSNIHKLGIQIHDSEGEAMLALVPANWKGWKWIEVELNSETFKQSYRQKDKNSKIDLPLRSVHFAWFAKAPGISGCIVDGLVASTEINKRADNVIIIKASKNEYTENATPFKTDLCITNYSNNPISCIINYSIQENSTLYNKKVPDPQYGRNHALGIKSWVEVNGNKIEDNSLTDEDLSTAYRTPYKKNFYSEVFQYVDLGKERNIKKIDFNSGDANWCWGMDVLASSDGKNYTSISDLQNINMHKRWGIFTIGPKKPFKARFLKLHFKGREEKKENVIRMPTSIMIYDGTADENLNIPKVGLEIEQGNKKITVPPKNFATLSLLGSKPLSTGAYFIAVHAKYEKIVQLFYKNYFVMPKPLEKITESSRFGINVSTPSLAKFHKKMGMGWVRFENMKWAFISPEKDKYAFDGSVKPWGVDEDQIIKDYTQKYQLNYLPYVFQSPRWASSAPPNHKNFRGFPPEDYKDYGKCIFQIVARYGSKKHSDDKLLTDDKLSGMNMIKVIELWNEPNLNAESWGPWVGS
ncbi:MAG: discoidin domain-containing protein, partial [Verrucomicrobiota bacterium]|nr:discoidin domain-containing protein [Verrucomicrobiota bacterium]